MEGHRTEDHHNHPPDRPGYRGLKGAEGCVIASLAAMALGMMAVVILYWLAMRFLSFEIADR